MTTPATEGPGSAMAEPVAKVKCLIVDDLEENLLALGALLREDGLEILKARSAAEALELLLVHEVALALVDVQMPETDGLELAELMRGSERTRHIPIVFVTAGAREQRRTFKGYDAGAVDFLYKPIDPMILRSKVTVFCELFRQKLSLRQKVVELSEALRTNEMFTAVLGHDLRSPLSAILTTAQLLQRAPTDAALVTRGSVRIQSSARRMSSMIEDVLDFSRARLAGGIPIRTSETSLRDVVQRAVQEHEAATPDARLELDVRGDERGVWDADRLAQVAANLIGNALGHGRTGSPIRILIEGGAPDEVTLAITNAGEIASGQLANLFDPFVSTRSNGGRREGGLGLGLYIVQQIAIAHGGKVEIETGDDRTEVRVVLPRRASASR